MKFFINNKGLITGPFDQDYIKKTFLNKNNSTYVLYANNRKGPWSPVSKFIEKVVQANQIENKKSLEKQRELEKKDFENNKNNHIWSYIDLMGKIGGPVSFSELNKLFQTGFIHSKTKVRSNIQTQWVAYGEHCPEAIRHETPNRPSASFLKQPNEISPELSEDDRQNLPSRDTRSTNPNPPTPSSSGSGQFSKWALMGLITGLFVGSIGRPRYRFWPWTKKSTASQILESDDGENDDSGLALENDLNEQYMDTNDSEIDEELEDDSGYGQDDQSGGDYGIADSGGIENSGGWFGGSGDEGGGGWFDGGADSGSGFFGGGGDYGGGDW